MCRHCELLLPEQEASLRGLQGQGSLFQLSAVLPVSSEHDEWNVSAVQETTVFVFLSEVMNRHPRRWLHWNYPHIPNLVASRPNPHN